MAGSSSKRYKSAAARRSKRKPLRNRIPKGRKKNIAKMIDRAIDRSNPDTVITTFRRTEHNSPIGAGDVGYFYKNLTEPNIGGLALVRRLAAMEDLTSTTLSSKIVGAGVVIRSLYYHGSFHINPFVFGDDAGIQNNQVVVHCWILSDKWNSRGNGQSDRNCVEDLLLEKQQVYPNSGSGYDASKVQTQMIPYSGTILDENLTVNRNRFKVIKHLKWKIVPKSADVSEIATVPNISVAGNLHRTFRVKIPTPKIAKWDRRDLDLDSTNDIVQTPYNVGDPFVVWGYTPFPQEDGPDTIATNLVVDSYLTLRCEPKVASGPN